MAPRNIEGGLACAAIDEDSERDRCAAESTHNVDRLLGTSTARNNVLDNEHTLFWSDLKTAPEDEFVIFFFGKDVSFAALACDFLTDHQASHRGSQNGFEIDPIKFFEQELGETFHLVEILADLRRLKKILAVQT